MKVKAIAVDVDGTLTDKSRRICTSAIDAIRDAEAAGVPVMIASGNVLPISWSLARFVGATGPVVAENGCLVHFKGVDHNVAEGAPAKHAFEVLSERWNIKPIFTDQWRKNEVVFENTPYLEEIVEALDTDPELSKLGVRIWDSRFGVHIVQEGIDKGTGVRLGVELLGLTMDDLMAVGDAGNDLTMIRDAGIGVAVQNARPEIKEVADHVTKLQFGDGFAEAVRTFIADFEYVEERAPFGNALD